MAVETIKIQERYTQKAVRAARHEEPAVSAYLKVMGERFEVLLGEMTEDREQRKQWAARRESTRRQKADMEYHTCHQKGHFALGKRIVATGTVDMGPDGGRGEEREDTAIQGCTSRLVGQMVWFLVDTGTGVSLLAARTWCMWAHPEEELERYWGQLCSVEGRALECLG